MIPVLYDSAEQRFASDGIGLMCDAASCSVTEERNGIFELSMTYPITGRYYTEIELDRIIQAKPNEISNPQPFRIYKISKPINGIVTVSAEHISYALNANPVQGFHASGNAQTAVNAALNAGILPHTFTGWSDIDTANTAHIDGPCSVRSCLGGTRGGILDVWGGEYEFDNWAVKLHAHRGSNTDVVIEYGKNLTDLTQEKSIGEMATAIMPYAHRNVDNVEQYTYLPEKYIEAPTAQSYAFIRVQQVDFSDQFGQEEPITVNRLRTLAQAYIENNNVGVPKVHLTVSFVPLWQTKEYEKYQLLERVNLCDTVTIRFDKLGVDASAKVIKTVYDTLNERYLLLELGDAKSNFGDTVKELKTEISKAADQSQKFQSVLESEIEKVTETITGVRGGHVVIKTDADGKPQEILILDTGDISTAKKVLRINLNGIGFSNNGINGPFNTAWTLDGRFVADFITTGSLNASLIKTGRIQSHTGDVYFDLAANDGKGEIAASILKSMKAADGTIISAYIGDKWLETLSTSGYIQTTRLDGICISSNKSNYGELSLGIGTSNDGSILSDRGLSIVANYNSKYYLHSSIIMQNENQLGDRIQVLRGTNLNNGRPEQIFYADDLGVTIGTQVPASSSRFGNPLKLIASGKTILDARESPDRILKVKVEGDDITLDGNVHIPYGKNLKLSGNLQGADGVGKINLLTGGTGTIGINASLTDGVITMGAKLISLTARQHVGISGTIVISKDMIANGNKNCAQKTEHHGTRLINAYETAEYYFGDIGENIVVNGKCKIDIEDIFRECVNTDISYQVFLTPYGKGSIYVSERCPEYFVIRGDDISFGWEIKAKRRGYENVRLKEFTMQEG